MSRDPNVLAMRQAHLLLELALDGRDEEYVDAINGTPLVDIPRLVIAVVQMSRSVLEAQMGPGLAGAWVRLCLSQMDDNEAAGEPPGGPLSDEGGALDGH